MSGKIGTFSRRRTHTTITTPTAVIGIRGSDDNIVVDGDVTLLTVNVGEATFSNLLGGNQKTVTSGNSSEVGADGVTSTPAPTTDEQRQKAADSQPTQDEVDSAALGLGDDDEKEGDDDEEEGADDEDEGDDDSDADDTNGDDADADGEAPPPAPPAFPFTTEPIASPSGEAPR